MQEMDICGDVCRPRQHMTIEQEHSFYVALHTIQCQLSRSIVCIFVDESSTVKIAPQENVGLCMCV